MLGLILSDPGPSRSLHTASRHSSDSTKIESKKIAKKDTGFLHAKSITAEGFRPREAPAVFP
jgi:hypothetical protein